MPSAITVAILILICAAPMILRFRPRWAAAFNLVITNRITGLFAASLPGMGILTHIGRKSGRQFHTPINVFRAPQGFFIALTYGPKCQWVQNVLAAGGAELETRHIHYHIAAPEIVHDPSRHNFPAVVRAALRVLGAEYFLRCSISQ